MKKQSGESSRFLSYIVLSKDRKTDAVRTYCGMTNNLQRRIRQHNGEIAGGARYTRGRGPWVVWLTIGCVANRGACMVLERAIKKQTRRFFATEREPLARRLAAVAAALGAQQRHRGADIDMGCLSVRHHIVPG